MAQFVALWQLVVPVSLSPLPTARLRPPMRRVNTFLAFVVLLLGGIAVFRAPPASPQGPAAAASSAAPAFATAAPLLDQAEVPETADEALPEGAESLRAGLEPVRCPADDKELPEPRTRERGAPAEWRAAYDGISGADPHDPPALWPLEKATGLPTATLVFERAEALVSLALPSGTEQVFDPGGARDRQPVWSADGKWLFFVSDAQERPRFGERAPWRVFRMRADGSERRAVSGPFCSRSTPWAVAPDGASLAYAVPTFRAPSYQRTKTLRLVNLATAEDRVVEEGLVLGSPLFTKDGRTLFYTSVVEPDDVLPQTTITAHVLETRRSKVFPQPTFVFLDTLQELADGRIAFVGDPEVSLCCRNPRPMVLDLRTGLSAPLGGMRAYAGFLGLRPVGERGGLLVERSQRSGGGSFADVHDHVVQLDAQGRPTRWIGRAFPRPFYAASSPAFLPGDRYVVLTLSLVPWRDRAYRDDTIVIADTQRPESAALVEIATGDNVAVRPTLAP